MGWREAPCCYCALMHRRIPKRQTDRARQLRSEATDQERILWNRLSRYRPKFTRQLSIGPFTADLACRQARLIVEVDGSQHIDSVSDSQRTTYLESEGWTVIRFWNNEVTENPDGVGEAILLKAAECLGGTHPHRGGRSVPRTDQRAATILPSREGRTRRPRSRRAE